ncbi:MAG: hypothetical protein QXJ17_05770 [Nitrososphaeria archaeon]
MRLRVKFGHAEVEFEGTLDEMVSAIDLIPKIIDIEKEINGLRGEELKVENKGLGSVEPITKPVEQVDVFPPTIQISKEDSIADIIIKVINSPWGKVPRRLEEVKKALEVFGFTLPRSTVAVTLLRLTKSGKIRRFKDSSGEFVYSLPISAIVDQNPLQLDNETNKSN